MIEDKVGWNLNSNQLCNIDDGSRNYRNMSKKTKKKWLFIKLLSSLLLFRPFGNTVSGLNTGVIS